MGAGSRRARNMASAPQQALPITHLPLAVMAEVPRLRRFAAAMIGDENAADRLVQEAVELTLADSTALPEDQDLALSLFTVLYQMRREAIEQDRTPSPAIMTESFERIIFQRLPGADREELQDFSKSVGRLSEEDRAILLLISLESFRYRDLSTILALPAGRVMAKVAKARLQLRSILNDLDSQGPGPAGAGEMG